MAHKKVEVEVDEALLDEVIRRYHLRGPREAINMALRVLVGDSAEPGSSPESPEPEDVDEFSDLGALRRPNGSA